MQNQHQKLSYTKPPKTLVGIKLLSTDLKVTNQQVHELIINLREKNAKNKNLNKFRSS